MITRIEATRYRCFDKLDVEFGDFRVLVGASGWSKTTLLDVPVLLGDMLRTRAIGEDFLNGRGHRASRAGGFVELIFQGQGDSFTVAIEAAQPQLSGTLRERMIDRTQESIRPHHDAGGQPRDRPATVQTAYIFADTEGI